MPAIIEPRQNARRNSEKPGRSLKPVNASADLLTRLDKIVCGLLGAGHGPSVTFLYEDDETREWARNICERMARLCGIEGVRASWWKISDLDVPGILAGAVSTAVRADIIVVATRGGGLPLPFYVWVNLWWPHRPESAGTLLALTANGANHSRTDVGEYLEVVAQQSRMEFLQANRTSSVILNGHSLPTVNGAHEANGNGHRTHTNGKVSKVNGFSRR